VSKDYVYKTQAELSQYEDVPEDLQNLNNGDGE